MYWYRIEIQLADGRKFTGYRPYPWKFKEAMTYFHSRQSTSWLGVERTGFSVFTVTEQEALQHGAPTNFKPPTKTQS